MAAQRKRSDDALVLALACGSTVEAAARQGGVSERTVYTRLRDADFQARVRAVRTDMVRRVAGLLSAAAGEAVRTLLGLMKESAPPTVRLGAARAVLELGIKVRELAELEAERTAATRRAADDGYQQRVAFLMMVHENLRMRVGIALAAPDGDESLHSWASDPFARWAAPPPGFTFPRLLVEWLLTPPRSWFLGHSCERCGLAVPLLSTWANDPAPPPSIVVFPACPACGGTTSWAANWFTEPPR